ncbi:hypothetical protein IG631_11016 [Alternaria alternata]|nr:hypothetical protein IG631_11016 [Alternaria alternata]
MRKYPTSGLVTIATHKWKAEFAGLIIHENADQQGGPAPPITTGHSHNPWLSRQGFAKRPRYPKVSGHTDRGKTDSATLCFGAGMLLARHGLFRDVNAWPHRKLVKLPDIPQTEWAYFTRPQHSGIFRHRHPS